MERNIYKEISTILTVEYGHLNVVAFEKITYIFEEIEKKQLSLTDVSQQRELLIAFAEDWSTKNDIGQEEITEDDVDDYIAINCC